MKKIVMFPSGILRSKTESIEKVDEQLIEETEELKKVLMAAENGAGLAAPQIGINKSFLGIKGQRGVKILINPKLEENFGKKVYPRMKNDDGSEDDFLEGCLSFPDLYGTVKRYLKIRASWQEIEKGKLESKSEILEGFWAIVWQHEFDHLEGVLFVDHIKEEGGKLYLWKDKGKTRVDIDKILAREKLGYVKSGK